MADTQETKTYFSKNGGLTFYPTKPKRIFNDSGISITEDGPMVQFIAQSDGFGRFTTNDPELIEACDKRMREVKDIFDPAEYARRITPLEKQLEEKERRIESQNRLMKDYEAKIAALTAQQGGRSSAQK